MTTEFKVGDVVCLSRAFLQSTMQFTGDAPFDEGVVEHVNAMNAAGKPGLQYLRVRWKLRPYGGVLSSNVILKSRKHLEPA